MKKSEVLLVLILAFLFATDATGQDSSKPLLLDEHGLIACDDTLGRIDVFFAELNRNPLSSGLVAISSRPDEKAVAVYRQSLIEEHTKWRDFDSNRFRIVRVASSDELKIQFWLIPPGASEPVIGNIDMSFKLPIEMKPKMIGRETKFGTQICPEVDIRRNFAEFLKQNENARANIVVRDKSSKLGRGKATRIVQSFAKSYGIDPKRIRIILAKLQRPSSHDEAIVEYWYLP